MLWTPTIVLLRGCGVYVPQIEKIYLQMCASEDSVQPDHVGSDQNLLWAHWTAKDAKFLWVGNKDSDQTVQMWCIWAKTQMKL